MPQLLDALPEAVAVTSVMVGEEEMTVNELIEKHLQCLKKNEELEKKEVPNEEKETEEKKNVDKVEEEKKKNEEKKLEEEKKANEEKAAKEKEASEKKANADAIKNAANMDSRVTIIETSDDKVARGKARYGSGN